MFNLQLSSVCLPCGHMYACMCMFFSFFSNTQLRTKKPNAFQQLSYFLYWCTSSKCVPNQPMCADAVLCVCVGGGVCFVWFDFRDWAMFRCLAHGDLLL